MTFEEENPAVKIRVTKEAITMIFSKRGPVECIEGLEGDYRCVGVVQNSSNGIFEFLLQAENNYQEGMLFQEFSPVFRQVDVLDKSKVKQAIEKHNTMDCSNHCKLGDFSNCVMNILKELGLEE